MSKTQKVTGMKDASVRSLLIAGMALFCVPAPAATALLSPVVTSNVGYTLTITPASGVTLTLDPFFPSTNQVSANSNSEFDSSFSSTGPFVPLSATTAGSQATATVVINGTTTAPDAEGTLSAQAGKGLAASTTQQVANFLVNGTGQVTFSLDYSLMASIASGAGDGASTLSRISLTLGVGSAGVLSETGLGATIAQGSTAAVPNTGSWSNNNIQMLNFNFGGSSGNDRFFADLRAFSVVDSALAPVPLPSPLYLLGGILAILPLMRRR